MANSSELLLGAERLLSLARAQREALDSGVFYQLNWLTNELLDQNAALSQLMQCHPPSAAEIESLQQLMAELQAINRDCQDLLTRIAAGER